MLKVNSTLRLFALPALLVGITALNATAAPLCTSAATLAALITDGSCQYQDKLFSNFALNFTGGTTSGSVLSPTVPAPSSVTATFSRGALDSNGIPVSVTLAFAFTANNSISNYQTLDLQIQYQVDVVNTAGHSYAITGESGSTTGAVNNASPNNAFVKASKDSCGGDGYEYDGLGSAPTENCTGGNGGPPAVGGNGVEDVPVYTALQLTHGVFPTLNSKGGSASFSQPYVTVGTYDEVQLSGGTGTVSATQRAEVTQVSNTFSEVSVAPEPGTVVFMGSAMIALCGFARRKKLFKS